jgi:hypothetical protein
LHRYYAGTYPYKSQYHIWNIDRVDCVDWCRRRCYVATKPRDYLASHPNPSHLKPKSGNQRPQHITSVASRKKRSQRAHVCMQTHRMPHSRHTLRNYWTESTTWGLDCTSRYPHTVLQGRSNHPSRKTWWLIGANPIAWSNLR